MQDSNDFIFCLDAPRERPAAGCADLRGWIAALMPIKNVRLLGAIEHSLLLGSRPDVEKAFPGHPFVIGFSGRVERDDLDSGSLRFVFTVGDNVCSVAEPLSTPPKSATGYKRMTALISMAIARLSLRLSRNQRTRWNAALRLLLSEIKIVRGNSLRRTETDRLLALFAEHFPDAVVLQIGANDGESGDPLSRWFSSTRWTGLLVEPVRHLYIALCQRYKGRDGLAFEQVAVSDHEGTMTLYRLAEENGVTPEWFQQLGSLDREVIIKHSTLIPDIEDRIVEEPVSVISLATLISRHALQRIDLLVIDTEGHDYQILCQVDFQRYRPVMLMFEHQHLSVEDKVAAYSLLRTQHYRWVETPEGDALAWRFL